VLVRHLLFSKYRQGPLREALEDTFGDRKLGESTKRLVIPSLNLETGDVHIFKTAHDPHYEQDYKVRAVDVALATAAAPTYFPTYWSAAGMPLVDGGMWANNPTGMAVIEAIGVLRWRRDEICVLSLGCTTEPLEVRWGASQALGRAYWGLKVTDVFMRAQSSASHGTAAVLVGHGNLLRISPNVRRNRFSLDGVKEIRSMRGLGAEAARHALPELRRACCADHAEEFVPFHRLD